MAVLQNSLVTFKTLNTERKHKLKSYEVEGGGEGSLKIDSKGGGRGNVRKEGTSINEEVAIQNNISLILIMVLMGDWIF